MSLHVIILAAGQGTRMQSSLPKVLHCLAGKPLLAHVIETARQLNPVQMHIVYGHAGDKVKSAFKANNIHWVHQQEQNGTGHAVQLAIKDIPDEDKVCILYGDVPLLRLDTLTRLFDSGDHLNVLTANVDNPAGYGRMLRDDSGKLQAIVEHRDANEQQRQINEINTGIMSGNAGLIKKLLGQVEGNNEQSEIYLTDIVALAAAEQVNIGDHMTDDEIEITGINDKVQLSHMERSKQQRIAQELMTAGVTLYDPARLDVRGELSCGQDVQIDINCVIEGQVELHDRVTIGPNVCLKDCVIGAGTQIKANCIIESADVGQDAIIGPFARIRPGTQLSDGVHVGNFVEIKKSIVGESSKINHLSYIGDARIGRRVNVGAGTITCNYDGANKHQTIIEDDAFIGSGSELVAPLTVGKGATIGAGSTLSKDVNAGELAVERGKQRSIQNWQRPKKA